ncbi:uncharacterized protein METZ01_LOCUS460603, partial [marine metagenome]
IFSLALFHPFERRDTVIRTLAIVAALAVNLAGTSNVFAGDKEDIRDLIETYRTTEVSGDLASQAALMTKNRLWIGNLRMSGEGNQEFNMERQQFNKDRRRQKYPDFKIMITYIDPIVRVYGNAAVVSFLQRRSGRNPDFEATFYTTLVLVKNDGSWKIDVTHQSPLKIPASPG